jgi:hypothetical protein
VWGGSSDGMAQRRFSSVRGVLEFGERRRMLGASAVVAGGGAHPFIELWRGGEAVVRGGDRVATVVAASMPAILARGEQTERRESKGTGR